MRKQTLPLFFGLTFLLSWSIWIPLALDHFSLLPVRLEPGFVMVAALLATLGPAVSALLVSAFSGGRLEVRELLGQLGRWRVKWTWYVASGLVFPVVGLVTVSLYRLLPGAQPVPVQPVSAAGLIVTMIVMVISVTGEEIGWRGFALPKMQKRWSALKTSLLLGTIHTIWHLPFWTVLGEYERFGWGYWLLSWAWVLALTIYITWIMNHTGNSLVLVMLFHWSWNIVVNSFLPITSVVPAYLISIGIAWAIALSLVILFGPQRLVGAGEVGNISSQVS